MRFAIFPPAVGHDRRFFGVLVAVSLSASLFGCSASEYELSPVTGVVVINGQPFASGKVMFAPVAKGPDGKAGRPAFGQLVADGSFSLTTNDPGDGAVVGEHWVTVIHAESPVDLDNPYASRPQPPFARVSVPSKVTVVGGQTNKIDVTLTRQDVAKYAIH